MGRTLWIPTKTIMNTGNRLYAIFGEDVTVHSIEVAKLGKTRDLNPLIQM